MIALLDTEVRRALARRLIRIMVLLLIAVIVIASVIVFFKSHGPRSDTSHLEAQIAACERGDYTPPEAGDRTIPPQFRQQFCRGFLTSRAAQDHRFHLSGLHNVLVGTSIPLMLICWLIGASLVGAEWKAGTITTTLAWEPRRVRVLMSKLIVALGSVAVLTIASQIFLSLMLLPAAYLRGETTVPAGFVGSLATLILRGALLSMIGASLGFSLGSIGRNTAAGMGVGFAYLFIVENALAALLPWIRSWLITRNAFILVSWVRLERVLGRTPLQSLVVLLAYAAGFIVLATIMFRRRDVTA